MSYFAAYRTTIIVVYVVMHLLQDRWLGYLFLPTNNKWQAHSIDIAFSAQGSLGHSQSQSPPGTADTPQGHLNTLKG